jgi:hypothetical protein
MEVIRLVYWLESDTFYSDDIWGALAEGKPDLEDRLQAAYCRMKARSSHLLTNGYLTEQKALEGCRGRRAVLDLLCRSVLDRPPLLHRKGDICDCLAEDWTDGYAYRIHAFLKRNPARVEVERNRAMKADRKDARLRALVYERDGGCCRYCRSGPLPTNGGRSKDRRKVRAFDHVNPEKAAEPDGTGYVVACDRCNTEKGQRLPEEADMVLLREPTPAERAAWLARDLLLSDRPDPSEIASQDRAGIAPETRRDRVSDRDPDANADRDPDANADAIPTDEPTGDVHPEQPEDGSRPLPPRSENPPGSGRGAGDGDQPSRASPPRQPHQGQPQRTASAPDIYTRRSRASPDPPDPGPPDYHWPPGSYPVEPRRRQAEEETSARDP